MSTKNTLALAALVVALPAALLGFSLVGTFLRELDRLRPLGTMYVALYGTTLAACAAVVFLPIGLLIFGPRAAKAGGAPKSGAVKAAPKSGTVAEAPPASGEEAVIDDESSESLADEETAAPKKSSRPMSTGELEIVEATPSMDDLAAYDDEAAPPTGEVRVIEEEDFAFDDEPEPPKKKGK